jgi:hypothetical protein
MSTAFPQPAPGTAPSPSPMKVADDRLRKVLGLSRMSFHGVNQPVARNSQVHRVANIRSKLDGVIVRVSCSSTRRGHREPPAAARRLRRFCWGT